MPKRYTCNGPKSVPNSKRSVPKNVSGRKSFPNLYFWEVATCQEPLILLASSYFPKSSFFLKTNLSIFWGTPHYSRRGTFHHPVASLRTSRKRVHDMNQNPVPSACFGKLSKRNLCDNNEASKSSEFAVFTRLPGYFAALSRHYIAPSDCAVTNEKSPAYGSVFYCLCKARFLFGYRMEQFAFFRLM